MFAAGINYEAMSVIFSLSGYMVGQFWKIECRRQSRDALSRQLTRTTDSTVTLETTTQIQLQPNVRCCCLSLPSGSEFVRMAKEKTYRSSVKTGNWSEDRLLEEDALKDYLEKKERGELAAQKVDLLKQNMLKQVNLSVTTDGKLHFGDAVMLVNVERGERRECTAVSINADINSLTKVPFLGIQAPCGVSAGRGIQPCPRTVFIITSVDGSPEGSILSYDQSFALKTTSGFSRGLYLKSDLQSFQKCAKKSRLQEVFLDERDCFLSWWKIVHFDPQERLEYEGQPVPANVKVVIIHCKTNHALAVLRDQVLWTTYGKEHEVTAHTFLDSHKAEQDNNQWVVCTSDPGGNGPAILNCPESTATNKEFTLTDPSI